MIDEVYEAASGCFAERLDNQTLHMTLHDLSNSKSLCDVKDAMKENLSKIRDRLDEFQECRIRMKTNCIFNMVNTSLVMGLVPVDENEHNKLMRLWNIIDGVKKSPYPLTPHITLGYYNVHGFSAEDIRRLEKIVSELNRRGKIYITLDTEKLFYQRFKSMNKYENVLGLIQQ
jgi:2'-5' RNA ligase